MGFGFFEAMRGELTDRWGRVRPFAFEVKAEAGHRRHFARTGEARLVGVVHAPPWADDAPLEGRITIRPLASRRIDYAFDFVDPEGRTLTFSGRKSMSLLRPVHAMTVLDGTLRRDGEELARGELRFDLGELLAFLASFDRSRTLRRLPLAADGLSTAERMRLSAFARAVIAPGVCVPPVDEGTVDAAERIIGAMPGPLRTGTKAALLAIDAAVVARTGRHLDALPEDRARQVVETLAAGPLGRVVHAAAVPTKVGHFSRRDYLEAVGAPTYDAPLRREHGRHMERVTTAAELPDLTELEAEVVVVGTGAGGASIATALAEAGVATLLLEEGDWHQRDSFRGDPFERLGRTYRDAGMVFALGRPPVAIPIGRSVGGSTTINSGTCLRTPDAVLAEWRAAGLPADLDPDRFGAFLTAVEAELQVGPNAPEHLGRIAEVVARGADALGMEHGPLPRNAPGCDGQATCVLGCPTDAKRSTNVSYVPRALLAGAELLTGLTVTRLLRRGRRVVGVEARGEDASGRTRRVRVRARAVVLSTGTLLTPLLLRDAGLVSPWLGRNLSVHPAIGVQARFDQEMRSWNAVPQGYGVRGLEHEGIQLEGYWMPPQLAAMQIGLVGRDLAAWMDAQAKVGSFGFMVRDPGVGRVTYGPGGRPLIRYDLDPSTFRKLRKGASVLTRLLLEGGAVEVLFGPVGKVRSVDEALALEDAPYRPIDLDLAGFHPLGTCRMGASVEDGVVDGDHRVFGTDNLYVVDGSAVRSSLGVNPQLTIMALGLRAGERLARRLG